MPELYEDLTEAERVEFVEAAARDLLALAAQMRVHVRIERRPLQPLAQGHAVSVVEVWPKIDRGQ